MSLNLVNFNKRLFLKLGHLIGYLFIVLSSLVDNRNYSDIKVATYIRSINSLFELLIDFLNDESIYLLRQKLFKLFNFKLTEVRVSPLVTIHFCTVKMLSKLGKCNM